MNHDDAHRHLSATDARMAELIARSRRYNIAPSLAIRPFDALAESIAYQQLSGKAAATIWGRVRKIGTGGEVGDWSDPAQFLVH